MGHTFSIGMQVGEVHYTEVIYLERSLSGFTCSLGAAYNCCMVVLKWCMGRLLADVTNTVFGHLVYNIYYNCTRVTILLHTKIFRKCIYS